MYKPGAVNYSRNSQIFWSWKVESLYLDLSKVFDKVSHQGIIFKLKLNRISGDLLNIIIVWFLKRKQRVVFSGQTSSWGIINNWASIFQWKINFNPNPSKQTQEILFSGKLHHKLFLKSADFSETNSQKHLGVALTKINILWSSWHVIY